MAYKRHCILTFTQNARVAAARHMRFDYVFLDRPRPTTGAISREARAQRDEYAPAHAIHCTQLVESVHRICGSRTELSGLTNAKVKTFQVTCERKRLEPADMQRTCCGNDHCGCQRCGRVLQVGSKPAPPFRHAGRDATIWWHGKLTPILHDMPVARCCSTSSSAASTTATHTACDHHCRGSAPSPAAAAIRKFRPGTTTRGHHGRAASISPLREENDLHGSICEKIGPGQCVTALTRISRISKH